MKREKPKRARKEMKQVHFDMELEKYIEFEKAIYEKGESISDFFRRKALDYLRLSKW